MRVYQFRHVGLRLQKDEQYNGKETYVNAFTL
jgi:hypothetical protein